MGFGKTPRADKIFGIWDAAGGPGRRFDAISGYLTASASRTWTDAVARCVFLGYIRVLIRAPNMSREERRYLG